MAIVRGYKMKEMTEKEYYKWWNELWELSRKLLPYYDIDKVKDYSVFVYTKKSEGDYGDNVFDINFDGIYFYDKEHKIIEESKPIIEEILNKFKEVYIKNED